MKKTNTGFSKARKIIIIVAAAIVVIGGTVAAKFYFDNQQRPVAVTDPSGSTTEVTIEEMKAALDVDTFYPGILVAGVDVGGKTKQEALALVEEKLSEEDAPVTLTFLVNEKEYTLDPEAISAANNVETVVEDAYKYNRTSTLADETEALKDRYENLLGLAKTPKDFPVEKTFGTENLAKAVTDLLTPLETEPVDATTTEFDTTALAFIITESVDGVSIDIDKAIEDALAAVENNTTDEPILVAAEVEKPAVTKEFLEATLGKVSSFTTKTSNKPNRNSNIDLVCKTVDGLVLQPGESFDFNAFIGKRTSEKGYKEAPGIYNGALRMELGGGICQTTGTLYHSVLMADLQVDERKPHSWPSDYVDTGTDATVTWGGANFKFTNSSEYPIAIHCFYSDLHVTMEIYGRPVEDGMTIEVVGVTNGRSSPAGPEYIADPTLPVGSKVTERTAHDYISATCYKIYYKDGVEVKKEVASTSTYPSIRARIRIGVLAPDGTICPMDPATGTVTLPTAPPPSETTPPSDTLPSDTSPSDTPSSETNPPTTETTPATTAAPPETTPSDTPAPTP